MKEIIGAAYNHGIPLSPAVKAGDYIFVSGQVPTDEAGQVVTGGITKETEVVMRKIQTLLEQAGASLRDVVKTTVYLTDIQCFPAMNQVYGSFFPSAPPARSCFEVKLAIDAKIEIEAIAYVPQAR